MRMLDADREHSVRTIQLYLSPDEAVQFQKGLAKLLRDPEANEHIHVCADDVSRELSCSIITKAKLADKAGYTDLEGQIFDEP